jgi:hypothetical protein
MLSGASRWLRHRVSQSSVNSLPAGVLQRTAIGNVSVLLATAFISRPSACQLFDPPRNLVLFLISCVCAFLFVAPRRPAPKRLPRLWPAFALQPIRFFHAVMAVVWRFCVLLASVRAPVRCVTDGGGTALGEISVALVCTGTERFVGSRPLGWDRERR